MVSQPTGICGLRVYGKVAAIEQRQQRGEICSLAGCLDQAGGVPLVPRQVAGCEAQPRGHRHFDNGRWGTSTVSGTFQNLDGSGRRDAHFDRATGVSLLELLQTETHCRHLLTARGVIALSAPRAQCIHAGIEVDFSSRRHGDHSRR